MKNYKEISCRECGVLYKPTTGNSFYCSSHRRSHYYNWSLDHERRLVKLTAMAKHRSKAKQLSFDITADYIKELWAESNGCCVLTGLPFVLEHSGKKGQVHPDAPSIDRIESSKGYVKGNVRLITYHMNVALSEFGIDQFERLSNAYRSI